MASWRPATAGGDAPDRAGDVGAGVGPEAVAAASDQRGCGEPAAAEGSARGAGGHRGGGEGAGTGRARAGALFRHAEHVPGDGRGADRGERDRPPVRIHRRGAEEGNRLERFAIFSKLLNKFRRFLRGCRRGGGSRPGRGWRDSSKMYSARRANGLAAVCMAASFPDVGGVDQLHELVEEEGRTVGSRHSQRILQATMCSKRSKASCWRTLSRGFRT